MPHSRILPLENMGKICFDRACTGTGTNDGLGCNGCHNAPEFDIDPNSGNNGIIGVLNGGGIDVNNTRTFAERSHQRRRKSNTPMMHTGNITTLQR
jgi:cytochrome c peroxidase